MKTKILKGVIFIFITAMFISSCTKKKRVSGVCYCSYLNGDRKEFDLNSLPRNEQFDSCTVLDGHANAFAGNCDLE